MGRGYAEAFLAVPGPDYAALVARLRALERAT
jgi:hypothetical protein